MKIQLDEMPILTKKNPDLWVMLPTTYYGKTYGWKISSFGRGAGAAGRYTRAQHLGFGLFDLKLQDTAINIISMGSMASKPSQKGILSLRRFRWTTPFSSTSR
jgi:hypothetical protein